MEINKREINRCFEPENNLTDVTLYLMSQIKELIEENKRLTSLIGSSQYTSIDVVSNLEYLKQSWKPEVIKLFYNEKGVQIETDNVRDLRIYEELSTEDQKEFIKFVVDSIVLIK